MFWRKVIALRINEQASKQGEKAIIEPIVQVTN
jgi:hypothetical protein